MGGPAYAEQHFIVSKDFQAGAGSPDLVFDGHVMAITYSVELQYKATGDSDYSIDAIEDSLTGFDSALGSDLLADAVVEVSSSEYTISQTGALGKYEILGFDPDAVYPKDEELSINMRVSFNFNKDIAPYLEANSEGQRLCNSTSFYITVDGTTSIFSDTVCVTPEGGKISAEICPFYAVPASATLWCTQGPYCDGPSHSDLNAVDIATGLPAETRVRSPVDGVIVKTAEKQKCYRGSGMSGDYVIIQGDNNERFVFAHLLKRPDIFEGQNIKAGEDLGIWATEENYPGMDNSSSCWTGAHIHAVIENSTTSPCADVDYRNRFGCPISSCACSGVQYPCPPK